MTVYGRVVHGVASFVGGGVDIDIPALQRPQHVEVAVYGCVVRGVVSTAGGMDVDPSLFELDRDTQMAVPTCPCGCRGSLSVCVVSQRHATSCWAHKEMLT